jgi:Na+-transporting methylmalonyl-CoA/oxaloacetate decarboxylase gamma subunit
MDSLIVTAVRISAVGMTMLFIALIFLVGLMYLLTVLARDKDTDPDQATVEATKSTDRADAARRQAAVIAVALARAEVESSAVSAPPPPRTDDVGDVTSWRAFHHQRQLSSRTFPRRSQR